MSECWCGAQPQFGRSTGWGGCPALLWVQLPPRSWRDPRGGVRCSGAGGGHGTGVPVHVHTGGLIGAKKAGGGKFQFSVTCPLGCRLKWGSEATACSAARLVQYGALVLSGRFDPLYETLLHILPLPAHTRFQDCLRFVKSHLLRWLKPSRDE